MEQIAAEPYSPETCTASCRHSRTRSHPADVAGTDKRRICPENSGRERTQRYGYPNRRRDAERIARLKSSETARECMNRISRDRTEYFRALCARRAGIGGGSRIPEAMAKPSACRARSIY